MRPAHLRTAELGCWNTVANMTGKRQPKTTADRVTVNGGYDGFVHLQGAGIGVRPRAGARALHLAFCKREILFQIAAGAKSVTAAGKDDRPNVVVSLRFLPRFIERPVKIAADGVLFLWTIQTDNRDVRIALLINT